MPVIGGNIISDPTRDIIKVAAVDRTLHPGKAFTGLIQGFGLKSGAMACSAAWDSTAVIVVGASDTDMALAVNRIRTLQGGAVICDNGLILAELALPIFGLMSLLPIQALADATRELTVAAVNLGISFPDPMLSLITLTGAAIPFIRICEEGLVNLKDGRRVDLIVEQIVHGEY
jgi:adenine deaminase